MFKGDRVMKRKNFFSKTMMLVLTVSMSVFIFAGCQSKDTNGAAQASNTNTVRKMLRNLIQNK